MGRPIIANIINESKNNEEEEEEEEEDYEEAADQTKSNQSRSVLETASKEFFTMPNSPASSLDKEEDPEIPPRRGDKSEEASRSSWQEDAHSTKRNSTSSSKSSKKGNCTQ